MGYGKRELEDRTQPEWSERNQIFVSLSWLEALLSRPHKVNSGAVLFWLSVELDGRNGYLCRVSYCDLRAAIAEPAEAKEVI